jgi:hypothetical protein
LRPDRKKEFGEARRRFNLGLDDGLLMLPAYFRLYITIALIWFLFDLDLSNV